MTQCNSGFGTSKRPIIMKPSDPKEVFSIKHDLASAKTMLPSLLRQAE